MLEFIYCKNYIKLKGQVPFAFMRWGGNFKIKKDGGKYFYLKIKNIF